MDDEERAREFIKKTTEAAQARFRCGAMSTPSEETNFLAGAMVGLQALGLWPQLPVSWGLGPTLGISPFHISWRFGCIMDEDETEEDLVQAERRRKLEARE
jgi:hypothetical protein